MNNLLRNVRRRLTATAVLVVSTMLVVVATALAASVQGDGTLIGTTGNDNINAGNGNDTVYGLGGLDSINAGNGNDVIDGNGTCPPGVKSGDYPHGLPNGQYCEHGPIPGLNNGDNINVGNGNDVVFGGGGHNSINVGSGNDTVFGGPIGDVINVNGRSSGTDYIILGAGGGNTVSTGLGTTIVYAQNQHLDTIVCHGNTTVYADTVDKTVNCTKVIYTSPSRDTGTTKAKHRKAKRPAAKRRSKSHSRAHR